MLYWIEAVAHWVNSHWRKGAALVNGMQTMSGHESNPSMLQVFATSMTSAASQLKADWRWYYSAIYNLNAKIIVNTNCKSININ